jgi:hypothetical protein
MQSDLVGFHIMKTVVCTLFVIWSTLICLHTIEAAGNDQFERITIYITAHLSIDDFHNRS